MGMATCEGTPGLTKDVLEEIHLTAGLGTPGDPAVGGWCLAEARLLCPATLSSTSGLQMEMWINESPELPIVCHPSIQPSTFPSMPSNTSKRKHPLPQHTHTFHISHWYSIAVTGAFEPQTPLFLHRSLSLSLHRQLSGVSECYHAPGNQRYSHMSQIGVNSYYSGEGVEGKWKLTYQKGHSCDIHPPASLSLSPFARPVLDITYFPSQARDIWPITQM